MKASKITDAQKAFIIRQCEDGAPVVEICRKAGISQATYFNWKKRYTGLMPSEMKRLRELKEWNGRLKRIVADLSLDKEMLQATVPAPPNQAVLTPPSRSNEVWAMDFVHDQLATGTKLWMLTVINTFSRYAPVVDPRLAYRGADVVSTLDRVCKAIAIRVPSASIRIANLCPAIRTCGCTRITSRSISRDLASQPTTPSSRRSTVDCGRNA